MKPSKQNNEQRGVRRLMPLEMRMADNEDQESRVVEGYAALFDEKTDMGWYREVIERGAFDNTDLSDVRALFNHNPDWILARTKSNTLTLTVDQRGLKFRFELPNTTAGNDLRESLKRGDIDQASFWFIIKADAWEKDTDEDKDLRRIKDVEVLLDISPVTFPAYETTTTYLEEARSSYDKWKETNSPGYSNVKHWENYLLTTV